MILFNCMSAVLPVTVALPGIEALLSEKQRRKNRRKTLLSERIIIVYDISYLSVISVFLFIAGSIA